MLVEDLHMSLHCSRWKVCADVSQKLSKLALIFMGCNLLVLLSSTAAATETFVVPAEFASLIALQATTAGAASTDEAKDQGGIK